MMAMNGCVRRDRALKHRVMPLQAKANGLQLCNVPPELSDLNALELRLISLSILVNTQVQSHALLRRGFGTSVPFIC